MASPSTVTPNQKGAVSLKDPLFSQGFVISFPAVTASLSFVYIHLYPISCGLQEALQVWAK